MTATAEELAESIVAQAVVDLGGRGPIPVRADAPWVVGANSIRPRHRTVSLWVQRDRRRGGPFRPGGACAARATQPSCGRVLRPTRGGLTVVSEAAAPSARESPTGRAGTLIGSSCLTRGTPRPASGPAERNKAEDNSQRPQEGSDEQEGRDEVERSCTGDETVPGEHVDRFDKTATTGNRRPLLHRIDVDLVRFVLGPVAAGGERAAGEDRLASCGHLGPDGVHARSASPGAAHERPTSCPLER